jgi:hypothetical protein
MRELRKTLLWTLALLIVILTGDRLFSAVLDEVLRRSQFRFSEIQRAGINANILVLGDSRGVTSINIPAVEAITGRRTFSLCYNGMATKIGEALLADYLDHNQPPRLMIIEVTSLVEPMKLSSELRTYSNLSPRLAMLYAEEHPVAARAGRVFSLLRFNSELYLRALYYLRRSDQAWSNWATIPPAEVDAARNARPWRLDATAENLDSLERILRLLRSRNVEVRLLVGPYLPTYMTRSTNAGVFIATVERRTRRVDPSLHVWNYSTAIGDPRLFADVLHLNDLGTEAFVRMLQRDGFFTETDRHASL